MSKTCHPRSLPRPVITAEARRIFASVTDAVQSAGTKLTEDAGVHVIWLAFAIDRLQENGISDLERTENFTKIAREAGAELKLSAAAIEQLIADAQQASHSAVSTKKEGIQ